MSPLKAGTTVYQRKRRSHGHHSTTPVNELVLNLILTCLVWCRWTAGLGHVCWGPSESPAVHWSPSSTNVH